MKVYVKNKQKDLVIPSQTVKEIVRSVLENEKIQCDEVSIHFVSTKSISDLHLQYFQDPTPTDCITFPLDDPTDGEYTILGDVFVCPKTALEYAEKHRTDPYAETTLYIVHGLLHLIGYDDIDKSDKIKIRQAEKKHMNMIKAKKLLLQK